MKIVWSQLNDHEINHDDKDTYKFIEHDEYYDEEWFMSFRLEFIME